MRTTSLQRLAILLTVALVSFQKAEAATKHLSAAAAEEMWLAVAVNGQLTGTTALVRYDHGKNLWVGEPELRSWRLPIPQEADTSLPGTPLYPLTAYKGLTFRVDETNQTLAVDAPAHLFESTELKADASRYVAPPPAPPGGFINYDIVGTNDEDGFSANAVIEGGAFGPFGTAVTRFIERQHASETTEDTATSVRAGTVRLDTTWTIDRPESLTSFRIGDSITGTSRWWGGAVRFGGLQWGTNFSTQPGLVTLPLPTVGGESALPSTIELYVNDALRSKQEVPGGPFTLSDVPVVSGDGQIRVVVRDMLGREQVITQSYYSSPRLLRPGLHDYSIEAGAARENFGLVSNDYGRLLVVGTERYGFTNSFTGEVHAELLDSQQTAGIAGGLLLSHIGVVSLGLAGSHSDLGTGGLLTLGFERTAARFSIGLTAELANDSFTRLGLLQGERAVKLSGRAFANVALGRAGSVSLLAARQEFQSGDLADLYTVRHTVDVRGIGYLNFSAVRVEGSQRDTIIGLSFSRPFGNRVNTSANVTSSNSGVSAYAQMQKSLPAGSGLGYRVRARSGVAQGGDASVTYQNDVGTWSLETQHVGSTAQERASMAGGIAFMDMKLFPSRRIENSFAVARVGDQADVRVYRDNQLVGRTDSDGYVILPGLRAYEDNQIRIEQADLPLDVAVETLNMKAVPAYRSGVMLTFPIERARGALLTVLLENGEPLPPGAMVTVIAASQIEAVHLGRPRKSRLSPPETKLQSEKAPQATFSNVPGQPDTFPSGVRGEVYISRLADQNRVRAVWPGGQCDFDVAYTPSEDPLPKLGPFECRAVAP